MLKSDQIISGLQGIANDYSKFAIGWHVVIYLAIILLFAKWVPSNRLFGLLLSLPLISVAIFAWTSGNPFNGLVFSISSVLVVVFSLKAIPGEIAVSPFPYFELGAAMVIFGLIYPHFLHDASWITYLYSAPTGLVPCPTLSLLIGFVLLYNGSGNPALTVLLIVLGFFYSLFGVFRLGVRLDLGLLAGTVALLAKYWLTLRN